MTGLSDAHRAALGQMFARCPDAVLTNIGLAVRVMPGPKAADLTVMLLEEAADRRRKAVAFAPLIPLFRPRRDGVEAVSFPPDTMERLWRIASQKEPALRPHLDGRGEECTVVADRICQAAAAAVRDQPQAVWPDDGSPDRQARLDEMAASFDLAHLARRGLASLPAWLDRPDGDRIAELRLLMRDASQVASDGAPRMLEILFAHVAEAALILRVVTQTSFTAGREAFLSESEMAGFVDRLIAAVRGRAAAIAAFRPGETLDGLEALKADIDWCAAVVTELDLTVQMRPTSPWGRDVREARVKVAERLSALLRQAERAVDAALPWARVQSGARSSRETPRLDVPAAGSAVEAARVLLALTGAVRGPAGVFGCESDRTKLVQTLTDRLMDHADQTLEKVNAGEAEDPAAAIALIELTADYLCLIDAQDAAKTVRRRAAVAGASTAAKGSPAAA